MNNTVAFENFYRLDENGHLITPKIHAVTDVTSVVLVPTEQVLLVEVKVPGKKTSDWQQALPFVLEEQLSQPVEQLFFAILHRETSGEKAGYISVAVVEKDKLAKWAEELKAHGLEQSQLVADVFAIPFSENNLTAINQNDRLIVRTDQYKGLAGASSWIEQLLKLETRELTTAYTDRDKIISQTHISAMNKLGLRQGIFAIKNNQKSWLSLWLVPIILLVALLLAYLAGYMIETKRYLTQQENYQQQAETLFKQMFPGTKRIVNIRAQTKSKLSRLTNNVANSGATKMLQSIESTLIPLISKQSIEIKKVQWKKQQLILSIDASKIDDLQLIESKLSKKYQVNLKLKELGSQGSKNVSGDIYVK